MRDDDLAAYARRRVTETCAAQGVDITPPAEVVDVVANLIGNCNPPPEND